MAATQKSIMYKCERCPMETDTCVKLSYDSHTECVEPENVEAV
jgi:hypothetical protein